MEMAVPLEAMTATGAENMALSLAIFNLIQLTVRSELAVPAAPYNISSTVVLDKTPNRSKKQP